jgi:hypothetical protein
LQNQADALAQHNQHQPRNLKQNDSKNKINSQNKKINNQRMHHHKSLNNRIRNCKTRKKENQNQRIITK